MKTTLFQSENKALAEWGRPSRCFAVVAAGLLSCALVAIAPAAAQAESFSTFSGTCEFQGEVRFDPPLTGTPQSTFAEARAAGPCSGTWQQSNGRVWTLNGDQVSYRAQSTGTQSCGSAEATGEGFFRYRGRELDFHFAETRVGATAPLQLEGDAGGHFSGLATATGDPAEIALACATSGVTQARVAISGSTDPSISG